MLNNLGFLIEMLFDGENKKSIPDLEKYSKTMLTLYFIVYPYRTFAEMKDAGFETRNDLLRSIEAQMLPQNLLNAVEALHRATMGFGVEHYRIASEQIKKLDIQTAQAILIYYKNNPVYLDESIKEEYRYGLYLYDFFEKLGLWEETVYEILIAPININVPTVLVGSSDKRKMHISFKNYKGWNRILALYVNGYQVEGREDASRFLHYNDSKHIVMDTVGNLKKALLQIEAEKEEREASQTYKDNPRYEDYGVVKYSVGQMTHGRFDMAGFIEEYLRVLTQKNT